MSENHQEQKASRPPFSAQEHDELCAKIAAFLSEQTGREPARALSAMMTISAELINCLPQPERSAAAFVSGVRDSMRTRNRYFERRQRTFSMTGRFSAKGDAT